MGGYSSDGCHARRRLPIRGILGALAWVTEDWIAAVPDNTRQWVPVDGERPLFIDGRSRISIVRQYLNIIVGDPIKAPKLTRCADGAELNVVDKDLAGHLRKSPSLVDDMRAMHKIDMVHLVAKTEAQMDKHVFRGKHRWRLADHLWSIFFHRELNLGNMDVRLPAVDICPPAFYPNTQDS